MSPAKRILQLVDQQTPDDASLHSLATIETFPLSLCTRPGELAHRVPVSLDEHQATVLRQQARAARVPGRVLLRVAVEAGRQLLHAEKLSGVDRRMIIEHLDMLSLDRPALATTAHSLLWSYATALRFGQSGPVALPTSLELPVSLELAAGWHAEAAMRNVSLDLWIAEMLDAAPGNALRWEAAAAESSCYLAEWVLGRVMPMTSAAAAAHVRAGRDSH